MASLLPMLLALCLAAASTTATALTASPTRGYNATATTGGQGPISSIFGPWMPALSYTWSQWITPTTVGTVMVTVNEATNETTSTTIYHSEYRMNGSMQILSPTNTNAAGTVTNVVTDHDHANVTMAYPTPLFDLFEYMTWQAVLPTTINETITCCQTQITSSPTPRHSSTFTAGFGSTDSADPSGWLYTLIGFQFGDPYDELNRSEITSLWRSDISLSYTGCPLTTCGPYTTTTVAPAVAVHSQALLLATSTTTISSARDGDGAGQTSVEVDPIGTTENTPNEPTPTAGTTAQQDGPITTVQQDDPIPTARTTAQSDEPEPTDVAGTGAPQDEPAPTAGIAVPQDNSEPMSTGDDDTAPAEAPNDGQGETDAAAPASSGEDDPAPAEFPDNDESENTDAADPAAAILSLLSAASTLSPQDNTAGPAPEATGDAEEANPSAAQQAEPGSSSDNSGNQANDDPLASTPSREPLIIAGETAIQGSDAAIIIASQTLAPGSSITLGSGSQTTVVAYQTTAGGAPAEIQVGDSSTITLSTTGAQVGGYIWSALGGSDTSTANFSPSEETFTTSGGAGGSQTPSTPASSSGPAQQTGAAAKRADLHLLFSALLGFGLVGVVLAL